MSELKGRPRTRSKPESPAAELDDVSHEEGYAPSLSFSEPSADGHDDKPVAESAETEEPAARDGEAPPDGEVQRPPLVHPVAQ